ncbi:MAG: MBL fold metallo-hydrolase [Pseudomonadota bacterium]
MRPSFHPRLINDPFLDPGLFIPFLFQKRALLFDLGNLSKLPIGELLKVTHVFVTHTHMDHFIGFDTLLRLFIGREKELHLFGPSDFLKHVKGKLAGYSWNLVNEYKNNFTLMVTEVHHDQTLTKDYACRDQFRGGKKEVTEPFTGILLKEPAFDVEAVLLDHRIPCMGLSIKESFYVNIMKEGLITLGLPVGAWLNRFKQALYEERDLETDFLVTWKQKEKGVRGKSFRLGELAQKIATISPGQKITYITDILGSPENREKVLELADKADHLFIEAAFLDRDRDMAEKKYHLTAKEAGELAKKAGVKRFTPFHFSPRYSGRHEEIRREAMEAFHN